MFNTIFSGNKDESEQSGHVCEIAYSRILRAKLNLLDGVETVYSPQSFTVMPFLAQYSSVLQTQLTDVALSKIEGLAALYLALSEVSSPKGFAAVLTLYAKTHSQSSLVSQLTDITRELFQDFTPQSSSDRPYWLDMMVTGLTDWKLLINSPAFKKVSRVLSLMVTLGVVDSQSITLGNFELFAVAASDKQVNAIDFIDALMETTVFFAEGAYQCFLQGSIRPLFFSSSEVCKIEEQYIEKCTEFEFVRNGNLEKFKGKSEAQFDKELTTLCEKLCDLYKTMPSGTEKKIVQVKWEALSKMSAEFAALRVKGGLRMAPFCLKIYGKSGVGKSTFADLVMATVLKANNKPATSDYIVTLNENEKYMSTYRSYVTGIKIDDYGNTKANFWETAPSDWIIKLCNNVREAAVMADVANKGKISIEPACVTITTNVEDLHAGVTSNCPMSVLRRAHVHVELKVRPEFTTDNMLDSQKVIDTFGSLDTINDIWLVDLKHPVANGDHFNNWDIIKSNMSIQEFLSFLVVDSRKHFKAQTIITDSFKEPSDIVKFCSDCDNLVSDCTCQHEMEPHFGERIANVIKTKSDSIRVRSYYASQVYMTKAEDMAVPYLLKMINHLESSPYTVWTNWVPTQFIDNDYVKSAILYSGADYVKEEVTSYARKFFTAALTIAFVLSYFSYRLSFFSLICSFFFFMTCYAGVVEAKKEAYFQAIVEQNGSLHEAFMSARDKHVHYACGLLASLGVLYGVAQVIKALRNSVGTQGSLMPRSIEDLQQRDAEVNQWKVNDVPAPIVAEASFVDTSQARNACSSMLSVMTIGNKFSGCFMLRTNVVLIPKHFLPEASTRAEITYAKRKLAFILNPRYAVQVGLGDVVAVYVPNTGPLKDNTGLFCDNYATHPLICKMYGLRSDASLFEDCLTWNQVPELNNGFMSFPGSHYRLGNEVTFAGMCMSLVVRDAKRVSAVGFHIGGVAGTDRGCGVTVLKSEIVAALAKLEKMNDAFMCGPQALDVEESSMGKNIFVSSEVHAKCPSRFIEKENAAVSVYGSVIGRTSASSNVIDTPISDVVAEVTGVENAWGPPRFKDPIVRDDGHTDNQTWKPWYASLEVCSQPSVGFDPADVQDAMDDYLSGLHDVFIGMEEAWKNEMRPLTDVEVVSGIDGKRFIDGMNASTSMGYPIMKKKKEFLVDLVPDGAHACPRTFAPEIWAEYHDMMELADQGYSMNQIFNACLKDEPTNKQKDKVRVFQAAPICLQIGIRKYFLPVARFLSANPLIAECAVGINSHGPEWHALSEYMARFGDDRIIAGDYSKYDLRMPEQLTIAAFRVMIKIAVWSGQYTAKDIKRMEALAFEVCSPLVAYNGTLMRFMGTNPSGQNMTVYLNSIVNSLLHRLAFNSVYDEKRRLEIGMELGLGRPVLFRDLCSISTYGDDAKGSVRVGYDEFNHVTMADYLARNDMKFTMPDKESEPVPFMSRYEADFLKRKDVFNPDLGVFVGQLDENSIFKSLHSIIESKAVSPIEVSVMNLEGALREWFFHGEKKFEERRVQVKEIARKSGIDSSQFDKKYPQRVEEWKQKYEPQSGEVRTSQSVPQVTAEHPMFEDIETVTKGLLKSVNVYADIPVKELKKMCAIRTSKLLKPEQLSRQERSNARIQLNAAQCLIKWKRVRPLDIWTYEDEMSVATPPLACSAEVMLSQRVKDILGKPTFEEYQVFGGFGGAGDLVYISENVVLVIECKRLVGRSYAFSQKVTAQAIKYANVFAGLVSDKVTVYALTYTEYGFTIVDVHGVPRFPKKFAQLLDTIPILH